jgi:hypothetical protein
MTILGFDLSACLECHFGRSWRADNSAGLVKDHLETAGQLRGCSVETALTGHGCRRDKTHTNALTG